MFCGVLWAPGLTQGVGRAAREKGVELRSGRSRGEKGQGPPRVGDDGPNRRVRFRAAEPGDPVREPSRGSVPTSHQYLTLCQEGPC